MCIQRGCYKARERQGCDAEQAIKRAKKAAWYSWYQDVPPVVDPMAGLAPQDRRRACFIGAQRHGIIYYYVYVLERSEPVPSDDDINTILTAFKMDDGHGNGTRAVKSAIADYHTSLREGEKYKPFAWTGTQEESRYEMV